MHFIAGSVLFFITIFVMEPSSEKQQQSDKVPTPRVMYDNGHDNKVFQAGEGLPQPQFTHPQTNGTTHPYYPNGNGTHINANRPNEDMQQSYRVIEDSRL